VFAADSRPQECRALTANEDCAVLEHPENVEKTHVASFDLDRREVTNEAFAAWLNANIDLWKLAPYGIVTTRHEPVIPLLRTEKCGDGLTITPENRAHVTAEAARWPVVCVSWYGANEYCRAHGKRLPLDVEWELAAKGTEGRPFPWGDDLPRQDGVAFELRSGTAGHPRPVGDAPQDVSPEGVHDLGGNAAEWVEDRRGNPSEQSHKTLRGGSFASIGPCYLLGSGCSHIPADKYQKDIGFRCARSVIDRPQPER
jgi:formylglycine-generating enzyme required for sulfatase activity